MISAMSSPFWMAAHAAGNIKQYQITLSCINLLIIPISWVILYYKFEPYWILFFLVLINVVVLIYRIDFIKHKFDFPAKDFYKKVIAKCIGLSIIIIPIPLISSLFFKDVLGIILTIIFHS
jgi:hypothetical protein